MFSSFPGCGDSSEGRQARCRGHGSSWNAAEIASVILPRTQSLLPQPVVIPPACLLDSSEELQKVPASWSPYWRFWFTWSEIGAQKPKFLKSPSGDSQRYLARFCKPRGADQDQIPTWYRNLDSTSTPDHAASAWHLLGWASRDLLLCLQSFNGRAYSNVKTKFSVS